MQSVGDVVDRAAGVEVRGAPHHQLLALGRDVVEGAACGLDRAGGLVVERDGRLAAGGGRPPPGLGLDQVPDGVAPGSYDRGGAPHGGGHDLAVDDHDAQVFARHPLLDQHLGAVAPGQRQGGVELVGGGHADRHAGALLTPRRA